MACAAIDRPTGLMARGVLVTVHDLVGGGAPLRPLELYLKSLRGYTIDPFRYEPREQNLTQSGRALAEFLRMRKPHTGEEEINFVTHGYGSLVLREAFRSVDWNYTKSKVVMLGPTNRGIRYHKNFLRMTGRAPCGGKAAEELMQFTPEQLDRRLGKLPRRTYPLVVAGKLALNPLNQANYPNDGLVTLEETGMPGEFRYAVVYSTHFLLPCHPNSVQLITSFLEA